MSVEQKLITAQDLWEMPEVPGKRFELVDGELVEMPGAGGVHMIIVVTLFKLLDEFVRGHDLGYAFPDGLSFIVARDPDRVRIPDGSFVSWERVPEGGPPEGYWPNAPDLAIEVVSPNDHASELQEKVQDYLNAGTQAVWVVWPKLRSITVHLPDGSSRSFDIESELDGGDVLPGLRIPVADIFASAS